ncbi:hypothetical protein H7H51_02450 [Mycolicibacterium farcinogenes]|nr:hypothetical protein [Mycolicibacterium farcinogenes]
MTSPRLVATAWTSAGDTSPMRNPATSPVPITERVAAVADAGFVGLGLIADDRCSRTRVNNRLLCGEGTFDLTGLIATLRNLGFDGPILSSSFRTLRVHDGLKLAAESAFSVLRSR